MPELVWEPLDALECLGVAPETNECDTDFGYTVKQSGITLELTIWPIESVLSLSLMVDNQEKPLTSFTAAIRGEVRYKKEKWGEYLVFLDCVIVPSRFYYIEWDDVFGEGKYPKGKYPNGVNIELSVYPTIHVEFT